MVEQIRIVGEPSDRRLVVLICAAARAPRFGFLPGEQVVAAIAVRRAVPHRGDGGVRVVPGRDGGLRKEDRHGGDRPRDASGSCGAVVPEGRGRRAHDERIGDARRVHGPLRDARRRCGPRGWRRARVSRSRTRRRTSTDWAAVRERDGGDSRGDEGDAAQDESRVEMGKRRVARRVVVARQLRREDEAKWRAATTRARAGAHGPRRVRRKPDAGRRRRALPASRADPRGSAPHRAMRQWWPPCGPARAGARYHCGALHASQLAAHTMTGAATPISFDAIAAADSIPMTTRRRSAGAAVVQLPPRDASVRSVVP